MKLTAKILSILVIVAIPFFLLLTSIRTLLTPLTPEVQYKVLRVPADPYGFTTADRLKWSKVSIDYLLNNEDISWLAAHNLPDGKPLFNDRELSHMLDVKILIKAALFAWSLIGIFLIAMCFAFIGLKSTTLYWQAVSWGGWISIGLVVAILVGVTLNFDQLFTLFHRIFFRGDTWLFYTSDNLIRLFPMEFWSNCFIAIGIITTALGLLLGLLGNHYQRKKRRGKMI